MDYGRTDWQDGQVKVVVNDEEQYSIWPVDREPPEGWKEAGCSGGREECLNYIAQVWRDMRPLSVRGSVAAAADPHAKGEGG